MLTKEIFKNEGILGFFRGFGVTVVREMPGYFFFFGGYELTRILLTPEGMKKDDIGNFCIFFVLLFINWGIMFNLYLIF